jgi:hypothetical protein
VGHVGKRNTRLLGGWSANLTLSDYGRVARHLGAVFSIAIPRPRVQSELARVRLIADLEIPAVRIVDVKTLERAVHVGLWV